MLLAVLEQLASFMRRINDGHMSHTSSSVAEEEIWANPARTGNPVAPHLIHCRVHCTQYRASPQTPSAPHSNQHGLRGPGTVKWK